MENAWAHEKTCPQFPTRPLIERRSPKVSQDVYKRQVHYPSYARAFSCKLGACRRTCCTHRDWSIGMSGAELDSAKSLANAAKDSVPWNIAENLRALKQIVRQTLPMEIGRAHV